jgi:hypothetical protein
MDTKYGDKYTICVYLSEAAIRRLNELGYKGALNEDEDGIWTKFSRKKIQQFGSDTIELGPPEIVGDDDQPFSEPIGNGSLVEVSIDAFDTKNYGLGTRLRKVKIIDHVPYESSNDPDIPPL